jgi:hypothetical protein
VFIIKFKEGEATGFEGAIFASNRSEMEKAFDGDLSNAFEGAKIQIAGKLENYRQHPEIPIHDPKQITILVKGPGHSPHASPATRPAAQATAPIRGIYGGLTTLSDDQRAKIAAIQKESFDAQMLAMHTDVEPKIEALLNDDQRAKFAAIQKESSDAQRVAMQKIQADQQTKIEALLNNDQRAKVAAIQKEADDAQTLALHKIQADEIAKINALLTNDQKWELKSLYDKASPPRSNSSGNGD